MEEYEKCSVFEEMQNLIYDNEELDYKNNLLIRENDELRGRIIKYKEDIEFLLDNINKLHSYKNEWLKEINSLSKRITELQSDKGILVDKIPKWFYVKEKLPPEPEIKDGISYPLTYICAYRIRDNENETGNFMYMGNGEFLGENKEYPIYAWLSPSVTIPEFKE